MNRRKTMRHTNELCRKWLIENGYDWIWFKPHLDTRKNKFKEFYYQNGNPQYQTDLYNRFDGICFDKNGILVFIQMSTTNYHPVQDYEKFLEGKSGFRILMLKAIKVKNKWHVKTKEVLSKESKTIDTITN